MGSSFRRTRGQAPSDQEKNSGEESGPQYDFGCLSIAAKILHCLLPGRAGSRSCTDEKQVPKQTSEGCHPEKTFKIHPGHPCRHRDEAADDRDKTAEKIQRNFPCCQTSLQLFEDFLSLNPIFFRPVL